MSFPQVEFHTSDLLGAYRITVDVVTCGGRFGHRRATLAVVKPLSVVALLPTEVSACDRIDLPLIARNRSGTVLPAVTVGVKHLGAGLQLVTDEAALGAPQCLLNGQSGRGIAAIDVLHCKGRARARVHVMTRTCDPDAGPGDGTAPQFEDEALHTLAIRPFGYPVEVSHVDVLDDDGTPMRFELPIPPLAPGAVVRASLYGVRSPALNIEKTLDRMMELPTACVEQVTSKMFTALMATVYGAAFDFPEAMTQRADALLKQVTPAQSFMNEFFVISTKDRPPGSTTHCRKLTANRQYLTTNRRQ